MYCKASPNRMAVSEEVSCNYSYGVRQSFMEKVSLKICESFRQVVFEVQFLGRGSNMSPRKESLGLFIVSYFDKSGALVWVVYSVKSGIES